MVTGLDVKSIAKRCHPGGTELERRTQTRVRAGMWENRLGGSKAEKCMSAMCAGVGGVGLVEVTDQRTYGEPSGLDWVPAMSASKTWRTLGYFRWKKGMSATFVGGGGVGLCPPARFGGHWGISAGKGACRPRAQVVAGLGWSATSFVHKK